MSNNDYNIKPVESLQNIANVDPAKHRQERKKQQNHGRQNEQHHEYIEDEIFGTIEEDIDITSIEDDQDRPSIDYRA